MKFLHPARLAAPLLALGAFLPAGHAEVDNVQGVKSYLVSTVTKMDAAAHDFANDCHAAFGSGQ